MKANKPLKKISKWNFVKSLSKKNYPYFVGLYSFNNTKVAIKGWTGSSHSLNAYCLKREVSALMAFSRIQRKNERVQVPKFIDYIENEKGMFLVTEYIKGKLLSKSSLKEQLKGYLLVRKTMVNWSKKLTNSEKSKIRTRNRIYFGMISTLLFPMAFIKNRREIKLLITAAGVYLKMLLKMPKNHLIFVHGDLHPENIIKSKDKYYFFDFSQSMISYPEYEDATAFGTKKMPNNIKDFVVANLSKKRKAVFAFLLIHINIHNLTGILSVESHKTYCDGISKAINIKNI